MVLSFIRRYVTCIRNVVTFQRSLNRPLCVVLMFTCYRPNKDDIYTVPQHKVIKQLKGIDFKYPEDRHLDNNEILTQLLMLEEQFNQQTQLLKTIKTKR